MEKWKTLSSTYNYRSNYGNLRLDRVELPDGSIIENYNVMEYTDWVICVAVTPEGKVLMEKQYRHGAGIISCELPAGTPEAGEKPVDAMIRELREETGYTSPHPPVLLGGFYTNPARNNNRIWAFLFTDCTKTDPVELDDTEEIDLELWTFDDVLRGIDEGTFDHQSTIAAIGCAMRKLGI